MYINIFLWIILLLDIYIIPVIAARACWWLQACEGEGGVAGVQQAAHLPDISQGLIMSVTLQENKTNLEYTLDRPGPARGQAK